MKRYHEFFLRLPLAMILVTLSSFAAFGAIYDGQEIELTQPDGTIIIAKGYGDEFYGRFESLDGYTLVRDCDTGEMVYADLSDDTFDLVPTGVVYDHRNPTNPNHPDFVARMHTRERAKDNPRGKHNGHGPALRKHLDLNKETIRQKQQQRRQELGLMTELQPALGTGEVTFDTITTETAASISGGVIGLTILVDFSDAPGGTIKPSEINDFCNKIGYNANGNNGSVRDYFYDVSGGMLEYTNIVTAYVRVPHTKVYYQNGSNDECTDGYGYTRDLVKDAIRGAIDMGYDLSSLTRENSNNRVKCLNIFYAGGTSCGWAKGLWPHRSSISNWQAPNGMIFHDYQMTNIGTSLIIGTFCHENGHMMCDWADYYDYGNDGISAKGLGAYCIMSGGNRKNPPPPNAYLRMKSEWLIPTIINDMPLGTTLVAPEDPFDQSVAPTCYKYEKPGSTKEFFLIENCQRNGRRVNIPDSGLMIWHVDTSPGTSSEYQDMTPEKHYKVSLEQADGLFHLETPGSTGSGANDLFHAGNNEAFNHDTLPDSRWWDGSNSGLYLRNISGNSPDMTFVFGKGIFDYIQPLNDMITWSSQPVQLETTVQEGETGLSYAWSADPATGVVFSNPSIKDPIVTITRATDNPTLVTLTLNIDDGKNPAVQETIRMALFDDACKAAIGNGLAPNDPADFNGDCMTGIEDLAALAAAWLNGSNLDDFAAIAQSWLVDYTLAGPVSNDLTGHWKFDQATGTSATDSSVYGYNGQLLNGSTWQPTGGKNDGALALDGVDDKVVLPAEILDPTQAFSVMMWVKLEAKLGSRAQILFQHDGDGRAFLYRQAADDKLCSYFGGTQTVSASPVFATVGVWQHVGITYDKTTLKMYVDGLLVASNVVVGESASDVFMVGTFKAGFDKAERANWAGLVDDLRVYNRPLSQNEIAALAAE